jgi:hypothetical protein
MKYMFLYYGEMAEDEATRGPRHAAHGRVVWPARIGQKQDRPRRIATNSRLQGLGMAWDIIRSSTVVDDMEDPDDAPRDLCLGRRGTAA